MRLFVGDELKLNETTTVEQFGCEKVCGFLRDHGHLREEDA